jgi:hypothetical protein
MERINSIMPLQKSFPLFNSLSKGLFFKYQKYIGNNKKKKNSN